MPRRMRADPGRRQLYFRIKLLLALVLVVVLVIVAQSRLTDLTIQIAESRAKNIAQTVINQAIEEVMQDEEISYDDLIILEKSETGQITALKSNIVESNRIKSQIIQNILKRLGEIPASQLSIPVGNLINSSVFSNMGPVIPIKLTPIGSVSASFRHEFASAGINQTRHQIVFDAKVTVTILVPGRSVSGQVSGEVTIAETIIVGNVPGSYTYFDATGSTAAEIGENLVVN